MKLTLLQAAKHNKTLQAWQVLADNPEQVHLIDVLGNTALHFTAGKNNAALVKLLLEKGLDVDATNVQHVSPLFLAASNDALEVVNLLLDYGADPNISNVNHATPLYMAARHGHTRTVNALMEAGANPFLANVHGVAPLDIAQSKGHPRTARLISNLIHHYYFSDTHETGEKVLSMEAFRMKQLVDGDQVA